MLPASPFVLLDDARPGGTARLYHDAAETVAADRIDQIVGLLDRVRGAAARGLHAAGYLRYEAAAAFEPSVGPLPPPIGPLAWFGLFERCHGIADAAAWLPDPAGAWIGSPRPEIDRADYGERFARLKALIDAGDLYQANLSFRADAPFMGDPLALYAQRRGAAGGGHGALVATGDETLLSFSPELFFRMDRRRLTCRPMKGTARRGETAEADRAAAETLARDPKQRAENLMIVDLMRNDLSRVALPGSVAVPTLFAVETYPTIHQMTSTVTATLAADHDAVDVLAALFPCGSITGAPKVRAMQALRDLEAPSPRGLYTGAIGAIDRDGDASFNVAIRTLTIDRHRSVATLGLGGGIVADSDVDAEWDEALAKGGFVASRTPDLIETMAFDPVDGIAMLERHLARLKASAAAFGIPFDRHAARNELQAATFRLRGAARVRLLAGRGGGVVVEVGPMPAAIDAPVAVAVVPLPVASSDFRLRHKTTDRGFYDRARLAAGTSEVAFVDPEGCLTEGSFTNIFVERDGRLLTPPARRGLLPGILRGRLIDEGRAVERDLTAPDLADGFLIGNALRGLVRAHLAVAG